MLAVTEVFAVNSGVRNYRIFWKAVILTKKELFKIDCKIKEHFCGEFSWLHLQVEIVLQRKWVGTTCKRNS